MEKLTQEQITAVDKALWDIGIKYLDIRIEMTDHAAATIESMEGSFERRLKKYIFENKKELKKNYRQFSMNASIKAVKLLLSNMVSFRFLAILVSSYLFVWSDYKYEGMEEAATTFLIVLAIVFPSLGIFTGYINFTQQRKLFSTAERLMMSVSGVTYLLCIPGHIKIVESEINDDLKLLYYAFVMSFIIMTMLTYRFLTKIYKSRYQVV